MKVGLLLSLLSIWKEGGGYNMEFLFELLKEIARAVVREVSAYALKKQFEKKTTKNPRFTDQSTSVGIIEKDNA